MSYIFPIGPYHPALKEPIHFKLYSQGEIIKEAEFFLGFNHKGIEKLAEDKNYIQAIPLMERVCGVSSHANSLAYCIGIESLLNIDVSKRANYIRVIFCELERIQSHYLWFAHISQIIAFDSLVIKALNIREKILDMLQSISGKRIHYGMNIIGGVRRNIDSIVLNEILSFVENFSIEHESIKSVFINDSSIASRAKGVGILTKEKAISYNTCGLHCRASGIEYDVRKAKPYCNYEEFKFDIPTQEAGDVFSRLMVALLEVDESVKILEQAVKNMPSGKINKGMIIPKVSIGESLSVVESPSGELTYFIVSKGEENVGRVSIHTATFKNIITYPTILKDNKIANAGLIIASINPSFAGLDR